MKEEVVDKFLQDHAEHLPKEKISDLRKRLIKLEEDSWGILSDLNFKSPTTILLLAIFTGCLGLDRFMLGQKGLGVAKLLTWGGCGIWSIIDWFTAKKRAREHNYNKVHTSIPQ